MKGIIRRDAHGRPVRIVETTYAADHDRPTPTESMAPGFAAFIEAEGWTIERIQAELRRIGTDRIFRAFRGLDK